MSVPPHSPFLPLYLSSHALGTRQNFFSRVESQIISYLEISENDKGNKSTGFYLWMPFLTSTSTLNCSSHLNFCM